MAQFDEMIATMKTVDYKERKQFLEYFLRLTEQAGRKIQQEDKDALLGFAYEEVEKMLKAIPEAATYKEKDLIFECEDLLLGIVMNLVRLPEKLPTDKLMKIRELTDLVNGERYLERTLDNVFEQPAITEVDINRLLYWARQSADEYQRGKLFLGLVHYRKDLHKLDAAAKQTMTEMHPGSWAAAMVHSTSSTTSLAA